MSEQENNKAPAGGQEHARFELLRVYIKDTSFQAPESTGYFLSTQHAEPEIKLQMSTEVLKLPNDLYEVTLLISVTAQAKNSSTFIYQVEVKQGGLFSVHNFPEEDFLHIINVACPGILFPFARQVISGLIERAGFAPLVLAPINFEALHQQHLQSNRQTAAAPADKPGH
jgi:preprotein translocase subunit SecB